MFPTTPQLEAMIGLIKSGTDPIFLSSIKTSMRIALDFLKDSFQRRGFRKWRVAVPSKICPHPVELPQLLRFNIGGLGNRLFQLVFRVIPLRPDFVDDKTLVVDSVCQIELGSYRRFRPMILYIPADKLFNSFYFKLTECHICVDLPLINHI